MARSKVDRRKRRYPMTARARCLTGRHYTVYPDLDCRHFTVEVYIARSPRHFREVIMQQGFSRFVPSNSDTAGMVISRTHSPRHPLYKGHVVAHMFLDRKALQKRPSETVAHECGHAAMAWARFRNADLTKMGNSSKWAARKRVGEELLCYSIGELVTQVNRVCYAAGAFA